MRTLQGRGIRLELPPGFEGRIRLSQADHEEETARPVVHAATFALPPAAGDFGGGAVELMRSTDVFVALVEFGPESLGTPLFAPSGPPRLDPNRFDPNALQRVIAPQSGYQAFFTSNSRPFCLYVVLGDHRRRVGLVPSARAVVERVSID